MPTGRASRDRRAPASSRRSSARSGSSALTALICLPTGILAAIYLEEYADNTRWYNRLLELNIQNLAGVPSIIFGILGLGIIARAFGLGFTVITAAIMLSLLVLPVVIIATREAIRAVPQSIRQALVRPGRHQVADHLAAGTAGRGPGHRHRLDPRAVPRHRRGGAADRCSARSPSSRSTRTA